MNMNLSWKLSLIPCVSLQEDYIDPEDDTDDNYIDPSDKGPAK